MGITEIFYETADFSKILDFDEHLKVSEVIHKAAAAASGQIP